MLDQVVFYFFAALAVASAILVVTRRNAVQSAIFLVTALLATAGIFLNLNAEFLFIVQVILYAGGEQRWQPRAGRSRLIVTAHDA